MVTAFRAIVLVSGLAVATAVAYAAPPSKAVPLPRQRPAVKHERAAKGQVRGAVSAAAMAASPMSLSPAPLQGGNTASVRTVPVRTEANVPAARPLPMAAPALRQTPALAMARSSATSPLDLAAVKQGIEMAHKGRTQDASDAENTISDPVARKLVEWVILRSDDTDANFSRYAQFIATNPSWPSIVSLRRRAEAMLWQEHGDPATAIAFFRSEPPHTAKGKFALARALLAEGDSARAREAVSDAWREDGFSADVEAQARENFAGLITPDDDKARMDARLYADDTDAAMRAAHHLNDVEVAIAKARAAVNSKSANAKALLDAVPGAAQRDPGYMFSRIQWLRHNENFSEATRLMLAAPRAPGALYDPDQWWVERRLLSRKLLDLGDFKAAYEVASGAAPPETENHRAEQQFTAGWIALRFLHEPGVALAHFAHIADGVSNPITLGRAFYWQGRAAEAAGHDHEARDYYEVAARYPTAYYGQLARARLGLDEVTLHAAPQPRGDLRDLEVARALEILYAVDQPNIAASMAADLADKANDPAALAVLAEIARRHGDARTTLLIGKIALGRGFPLEQFAFPDFGVPNFTQIGPEVDRSVIYSIVRQESAFNPRDVSGANAMGLMQVTPAAGRDTARRFKVPFDQHRLATDVVYNAQLGSAELGNDLASYRGSYILAFVAYNAGPGRARQWMDQYGDPRDPKVDPIDWIERIPIAETRNYVQRVLENMQVYRARIDNNSKLLIEADLRRGG